MHVDRRSFLKKSVRIALAGAGLGSTLGHLRLLSAATNARPYVFDDYRALVCVFLYGGNDSFNTIVPVDADHYAQYAAMRTVLALPQSPLLALNPRADGMPGDGGQYGLHPSMGALAGLFNDGRAAVIANVGPLVQPVSKADYMAGNVPLPPQLFSHADQESCWQSSPLDNNAPTGWGGRIADLLHGGNANPDTPTGISLAGEDVFLRGRSVNPYIMSPDGALPVNYEAATWNSGGVAAFDALRAPGTQANLLERTYAASMDHTIRTYQSIGGALAGAADVGTFPASYLGSQLAMVAKLISVRAALGVQRQVFFVTSNGYDTHDAELATQEVLLGDLSASLAAFYDATVQLGVADSVTAFTASDFGRTLSINGNGTDHGWGAQHFVVGGAVAGQRFYGTMPSLLPSADNPDDAGWGQMIPGLGADQYSATLARWFGIGESDLDLLFPNLLNFASRDLGFLG
ncbi:MAG TPA: DUF1501 domain-containing protein [Dokdonella sp.]